MDFDESSLKGSTEEVKIDIELIENQCLFNPL